MSNNGQPSVTVCLGQPAYGNLTAGAARSFWRATSGSMMLNGVQTEAKLECYYSETSLLALSFNLLWCWALNRAEQGKPVDYFAMLHSDIEVEDFWLDKLIAELEEQKLDVLSAVVPIKDGKGITSVALERPDHDNWNPHCRLSMDEVINELPVTFTSNDVGYPLLLNTGCWVAKFDIEWAKLVHFTINDRVIYDKSKSMYVPQVESEDWYFSRLLNEMKLKVGATRIVKIDHIGKIHYSNYRNWGTDPFDMQYVEESAISKKSNDGFVFPANVDGWLLPAEGRALADAVRGKRVLEIGSYCGLSTICMAQTAESVVSIDPHDGRCTPRPKDTYQEFVSNLEKHSVADKVVMHRADNLDVLEDGEIFDVIYIDGAHDMKSVQKDIEQALLVLDANGVMAFHDYTDGYTGFSNPGVAAAVDEFIRDGAEIIEKIGSMVVVRPPALKLMEA